MSDDFPGFRSFLPVERWRNPPPLVTVVRLEGMIGRTHPMGKGLTLATLAPLLERAFKPKRLKAVALAVNSPGGSPVQSSLIAGHIRQLAEERGVKVWAFAEDLAASGGYWLACAADEIYADPASVVGSIGVVSGGFGFPELLKKMGVERRLHTAGTNKARRDPFQREKPEDVEHLRDLLADLHETFRALVRERRGDRLKRSEDELFTGDYWTGRKALELGLIDGLGDLRSVLRAEYGDKVKLKAVTPKRPLLRLPRFGAAAEPDLWADAVLGALETRLERGRYGF